MTRLVEARSFSGPAPVIDEEALDSFVNLLLAQSPRQARAMVLAAADAGAQPREIYLELLAPALREVGARWQVGTASIAQEHLATAVVSSIMAGLAPRLEELPPVGHSAVLACIDSETHDVGLRMVGDFLEADGWETLYLGAATPAADLVRLAEKWHPDVVGLSTTLSAHLGSVRETVAALRALPGPPFVILGGMAYNGLAAMAESLGADAFASDAGVASGFLRSRFSGA
jgi:methanogenic corrinoid protein MtbC1